MKVGELYNSVQSSVHQLAGCDDITIKFEGVTRKCRYTEAADLLTKKLEGSGFKMEAGKMEGQKDVMHVIFSLFHFESIRQCRVGSFFMSEVVDLDALWEETALDLERISAMLMGG